MPLDVPVINITRLSVGTDGFFDEFCGMGGERTHGSEMAARLGHCSVVGDAHGRSRLVCDRFFVKRDEPHQVDRIEAVFVAEQARRRVLCQLLIFGKFVVEFIDHAVERGERYAGRVLRVCHADLPSARIRGPGG